MEAPETSGIAQALGVVRRQWLLLLLTPLLAGSAGYGATQLRTPMYEASASLVAGQGGSKAGSIDQIDSANQAAVALGTMANDRVVIQQALADIGEDVQTSDDLLARTRVEVPPDSQKIVVTVTDPDPKLAARHADAIASSFADLVDEQVATHFDLAASVWQHAEVPSGPVSPNVPLTVVAATLLGLLLGGALAVMRESLDPAWRGERDVEQSLGQPVLAVIPRMRGSRQPRTGAYA